MLFWLFPLLLLSWLTMIFLGRSVRRRLAGLDPAAREHFPDCGGEESGSAVLLRTVMRGQFRDVPNPGFVRYCALYRASGLFYFLVLGSVVLAVVLSFISG